MNEAVAQQAPMAADGVTAGSLLRQAREASGLHVATLAVSLKVPVRKLEALEQDRYDLLSDAVFVRALASSVCRTLKIDPQPVLERLPQSAKPRLVQDSEGINAPFRAPGDGPRASWAEPLTRPATLAVALLLLGALLIVLWPNVRRDEPTGADATKVESVVPPGTPAAVLAPPAEMATAPEPSTPAQTSPAAAQAPAAGPAPAPASALAPAPAPAPALAPATVAPAAPASAPAVPGIAPAEGVVTFRTSGRSWIQVTDANGTAVLRRLMEAGETAGASGALPLSVTVGSVRDTEVQVRGKPLDMKPIARDNVARFEVK